MYRWKTAGRHEAFVFVTVMLLTPTISYILPTEPTEPSVLTEPTKPTTTSPERDCILRGDEWDSRCACDPQCAQYGDCCRSSPYFVPEEQRLGASPFTCMTIGPWNHIYMYTMATCPPDWKDSDTRNRCEHPDESHRDPLLDAPLTSFSTNTTYRNWHCAYCHGDLDAATTVIWKAWFHCCDYYKPTDLSDETIVEHLSFNPLTSKWNLNISLPTSDMKASTLTPGYIQHSTDNNEQEIHCNCFVKFMDTGMNLPIRLCNIDEIRKCPESWKDAEVKVQCEAYTARVCGSKGTYRNRHCMLCNNDVLQPCVFWGAGVYVPPSITKLLDWRRLKRGECASSEVYDPLSCVCRKVFI